MGFALFTKIGSFISQPLVANQTPQCKDLVVCSARGRPRVPVSAPVHRQAAQTGTTVKNHYACRVSSEPSIE